MVHAYRKNNIFFWHLEAASAKCSSSPSHHILVHRSSSHLSPEKAIAMMMITLRDPQKVISPAGWSPPLGDHRIPCDRHSQVIATKPGDRPPRLSHRITSDRRHYPGDRLAPVIATANRVIARAFCKWSQLSFSMELKVWVEGIQRIVCGVTEKTTCQVSSRHDPDRVGSDRFPGLE